MVAQSQGRLGTVFRLILVVVVQKEVLHGGFPDPLEFLLSFNFGHVMSGVAYGGDSGHNLFGQFGSINDHGPA